MRRGGSLGDGGEARFGAHMMIYPWVRDRVSPLIQWRRHGRLGDLYESVR